jgi:hypothetical protein
MRGEGLPQVLRFKSPLLPLPTSEFYHNQFFFIVLIVPYDAFVSFWGLTIAWTARS